jgi:pSer/pThr/pTyr-binding forkhead associated (FHA) protein
MAVTVIVRSGAQGKGPPPSITLDAPIIVLGRGEGCDVRLPDPSVSQRHATLRQRGSEHMLVDEGSTNGTHIGGVRLGSQASRIVRNGELVRLGRVWIELRFEARLVPPQGSLATRELALALVSRALDAQGEAGGARLVVVEGRDAGASLDLAETSRAYVLGRGREADLVLDDEDASRKHLQVVRRADQVLVRDLGSKNGATIDDAPVPSDRDVPWKPGQRVAIGATVLVYEHPALEALRELEAAIDESLEGEAPPPQPGASGAPPPSPASVPAPAPAAAAPALPLPRDGATKAGARQRWSSADVAVVLLALGVMALSGAGLWLLLH